jgi:hypothetical protein
MVAQVHRFALAIIVFVRASSMMQRSAIAVDALELVCHDDERDAEIPRERADRLGRDRRR